MMLTMMANLITKTYIMTMFTIIDDQDDDYEYMIINIAQGYGNNCELDHLQDVYMTRGVDRDGDYDNDDKNDDNGDGHFDAEGPLGPYKENFR